MFKMPKFKLPMMSFYFYYTYVSWSFYNLTQVYINKIFDKIK